MSNSTKIEWCDSTFNPWIGCTKISPACDHCYAAVSTPARALGVEWGHGQPRRRTSPANWKLPLRWNAQAFHECVSCGWRGEDRVLAEPRRVCPACSGNTFRAARRRVFCASLADVFDNEVDPQWRRDLFSLIVHTNNLDWLLLTKRIGNVSKTLDDCYLSGGLPWNVWLGATICNQAEADRDIPKLLAVPAAVRFLSMEPLLGAVDIAWALGNWAGIANGFLRRGMFSPGAETLRPLDWIIAGGESGPGARPMHPDWVRSIRDQCADAGVPFLFKQWGEWAPAENRAHKPTRTEPTASLLNNSWHFWKQSPSEWLSPEEEPDLYRVGKKAAGRMLDGRLHDSFPEAA